MTVDPQAFVMKMAERWQNSLRGVATSALREVWRQQAETFNAKINGEYPSQWMVLQPATGSGKSRGLETYCAMLSRTNHPGVLIVVRMIEDANAMTDAINALVDNTAITFHSENDVKLDDLFERPVIVITHSAYRKTLETILWDKFSLWKNGKRKLVVIDEALNVIDQIQVDFDQLREMRGVIPDWLQKQYADECRKLDQVIEVMSSKIKSLKISGANISPKDWGTSQQISLLKLGQAIRRLNLDEIILKKFDEVDRKHLTKKYCDLIDATELLVKSRCWYAKKGNLHLFTRSRMILPNSKIDAVVMDATASLNPVYKLLGEKAILLNPPQKVRSYANVTVHASIGHKVGKLTMSKHIANDVKNFIANVANKLQSNRNVFICTHKAVESHLIGYDKQMPQYAVAHWGAIDGKNLWNRCDAAVMYGLPYLDKIVPETTIQAIEEWRGKRFSAKNRGNIIRNLEEGYQIVSLIQAMNRIRCRNVVDKNGNCPETDIYLLLPNKARAATIIKAVSSQMPDMKYKRWHLPVLKRNVRRSRHEPAVIAHLKGKSRGSYKAQDIRRALNIPATSFDRLINKALNHNSKFYRELAEISVLFRRHGNGLGGRGCYSVFEKAA